MIYRPLLFVLFASAIPVVGEPTHSYLPLTPGRALSYKVTTKVDQSEPQSLDLVIAPKQPAAADQPVIANNLAYQSKPDGVYLVGAVSEGKVAPLNDPQKILPADPKAGDKWEYREDAGATSATCLGVEKIKVPAGEYDAIKVYLVTIGGPDGNFQRDTYRWFAKDVGVVKETLSERAPLPDGKVATREMTTELASVGLTKTSGPGMVLVPPSADALFAQAQAAARKGDHKSALRDYDGALAADPKGAKFRAYKTLSLIALKQFDAAEAEINQALAADPKDYTFAEIAGQLKVAQGQIKPGKSLYDQAAKLSPQNGGAIYTDLAAALSMRNDDRLAADIDAALKSAAAATPPSPSALFALGQSYANAGRPEAKQYLQRYIEVATALPKEQRDEQKLRLAKQLIRAIDIVKGVP